LIHALTWLFCLLGCWEFNCIFTRTSNNLSYSWCCCFFCWKGLWSGRTRAPSGCFWFGHHHGIESSGGKSHETKITYIDWSMPNRISSYLISLCYKLI